MILPFRIAATEAPMRPMAGDGEGPELKQGLS